MKANHEGVRKSKLEAMGSISSRIQILFKESALSYGECLEILECMTSELWARGCYEMDSEALFRVPGTRDNYR